MLSLNRLITLAMLCLFTFPIKAQFSPQGLDTVTITASRTPESIRTTGRHITTISGETLRALPGNSIDEWLRFLPGVEAQSRGAFGVQSDLILRGGTFSQVMVLVDGMRINDPLTGHFNSYLPVAPGEVARIEILKGPAAALYGADAMGGVIHVITKTYDHARTAEPSVSMEVGAGQHHTLIGSGGTQLSIDRTQVSLGFQGSRSDGHPLPSDLNGWFKTATASAAVRAPLGREWDLMVRTGFDQRAFNAQYFYTASPFDLSEEETAAWWSHAKLSRNTETHQTELDVAYKFSEDEFLFNPAFGGANMHQMNLLQLQAFHNRHLSSTVDMQCGLQLSQRAIESSDRGNHSEGHAGLFAGLRAEPVNDWHVYGALRMDADGNYGVELNPQLSTSLELNNVVLRAMGGRSIRAADFTERYISTNLEGPLSSGRNLGNPDLKAEQAWSTEFGVDVYPATGLRFSATAFYRDAQNVIDYVVTPFAEIPNNGNLDTGATYLYASNIAAVQVLGMDAEVSLNRKFGSHRLQLLGGFTWQQVETDEPVAAKYITGQARQLFTATVLWQAPWLHVSVNGLYKLRDAASSDAINANLTPSYTVWHIRMDVPIAETGLAFFGQVHNLFDTDYADILGTQMPGRWLIWGLRYRIQQSTK